MSKGIKIQAPKKGDNEEAVKRVIAKKVHKYITAENKKEALLALLDPTKVAILMHKAQEIYWIGAKDSGKSRPVFAEIIVEMEINSSSYCWVLKKFKGNAADKAHANLSSIAQELASKGFKVNKYEKGQSETFKMVKKKKTDNQSITYASFDNYDSLAGLTAPNNGQVPIVALEEVASINGVSPEEEDQFDVSMNMIKASMSRVNRNHQAVHRKTIKNTKYHYMTNNWDDHPILELAERYFPGEEWKEFVIKDLINNNIKARYDKMSDKLFVRNTTFNNPILRAIEIELDKHGIIDFPTWDENNHKIDYDVPELQEFYLGKDQFEYHLKEYKGSILNLCKQALKNPKSIQSQRTLGTYLGFNFTSQAGVDKTYPNSDDIVYGDSWKVLRNSDRNAGLKMAIDVDENRRFVLSGTTTVSKTIRSTGEVISNLLLFPQVTILSHGSTDNVKVKEKYLDQICREIDRMYIQFENNTSTENYRPLVAIDENHSAWVPYIKDRLDLTVRKLKGKQSTDFKILRRQSLLNHFIDTQLLIVDSKNINLRNDIIKSVKKLGQDQRDESGSRSKWYDYLNSFEYSFKPLINSTLQIKRPGKEYEYNVKR